MKLVAAFVLSGCATLTNAISTMNKEINTGINQAAVSPQLNFYVLYGVTSVFSASDGTIDKVRYRDPGTGKVREFIPEKSKEKQQPQPAQPAERGASSSNGSGNGDKVTVTKDKQTVTVKAGTFRTEHTTYVDSTASYREEIWTSEKVPGALVKYINTDTQSGDTSQGQLAKIESGIGTVLASF